MVLGVPVEAALPLLGVACGAAFFTCAALAARHRTGRLLADLAAGIGRQTERLRTKGFPAPILARLEKLRDEIRGVLARHGMAARPGPRAPLKRPG